MSGILGQNVGSEVCVRVFVSEFRSDLLGQNFCVRMCVCVSEKMCQNVCVSIWEENWSELIRKVGIGQYLGPWFLHSFIMASLGLIDRLLSDTLRMTK